ncbi:hypothetical protein CEXT_483941 [Caerostris extrusa]|uniref:Uncharacterized protein n=1 Tax=Caerostris extrusa TaxID=172846 RepID=A0AAV4PHS6_CAEEX|nr:hypothetical protein CEXT_483941 [Caerostris extrusa]
MKKKFLLPGENFSRSNAGRGWVERRLSKSGGNSINCSLVTTISFNTPGVGCGGGWRGGENMYRGGGVGEVSKEGSRVVLHSRRTIIGLIPRGGWVRENGFI